jgi:hypothetical protein
VAECNDTNLSGLTNLGSGMHGRRVLGLNGGKENNYGIRATHAPRPEASCNLLDGFDGPRIQGGKTQYFRTSIHFLLEVQVSLSPL